MSEAARKQIASIVEENEQPEMQTVVEAVAEQQEVSEVTAETYVRDYTTRTTDQFGNTVIESMKDNNGQEVDGVNSQLSAAETESRPTADGADDMSWGDDDVVSINQDIGDRTGDSFFNLPILEDVGHPSVPEVEFEVKQSEAQNSGRTVIDIITKVMEKNEYAPLLIGEAGTGKDIRLKKIAAETNRPAAFVNFGVDTTYEKLIGMYQPTEDGHFQWRDGLLTWCVRNGGIFVADEINAAPPEATMALHGVTQRASNRHLTIQETGEVIEPHPEFRFAATMNPEHYAGTQEMNAAFKTRFFPIETDYLDQSAEVDLITSSTPLSKRDASNLVSLANNLRNQLAGGTIDTPVSPRELIKIGEISEGGNFMSVNKAAEMVLTGIASPADTQAISKAIETQL